MFQKVKSLFSHIKILRSFQARIFILIVLAGALPIPVIRYGILETYRQRTVSGQIADVQAQGKMLTAQMQQYRYLEDPASETVNAVISQFAEIHKGRILVVDRDFRVVRDTAGMLGGKILVSETVIRCFNGGSTVAHDEKNRQITITLPIMPPLPGAQAQGNAEQPQESPEGVLVIVSSAHEAQNMLEMMRKNARITQAVLTALIIVLAAGISYLTTRPFRRVTAEIRSLQAGHFNENISVPDYSETEQISDAFNDLYAKISALDESRDEFVANVSHELKTPITSVKVLADSLLMQEEVPAELYREFMVDIADEIDRENKLINDLLSLVKMDKKQSDLTIEQVDVNSLLETILKRLRPIAMKYDVEMTLECIRPVVAQVDQVKFTSAVTNLVENAIKYNREKGWVKVLLDADHQYFTVEVSDGGIGIPEDCLEQIFERFYRVDKSHSRQMGGTGLGLAITRNAVLLHKGTVGVSSVQGEGTVFTVRIPLTYVK